jgi:hypothetical protein
MKTIRFSGLVRLANRVQRELRGSVPHTRREELRRQVRRAVELVELTLGAHGVNLSAVPGPSRRAYEFLRTLNFDLIPTHSETAYDSSLPATRGPVVLRGLMSSVQHIADGLARVAADAAYPCSDVQANIEYVRRRIEESIWRSSVRCEDLTTQSREHLAWLRFMSSAHSLHTCIDAIRRASAAFHAAAATDRWPRPIVVHFRPTQSVFRARAEPDRTRVLLPTPMITLADAEFGELAHAVFGRHTRRRNARLHAILLAEHYQELRSELEALAGFVEETRGMVHDLAQSFDRVNATYFAGQMPRPRLTWNRSITAGKFGHYHYATDTVMISRALDRPQVPTFVVDHVMHHELLHKKHGLSWSNGRGHAHTAGFRQDEREFVHYAEADQFLQALARGLQDVRGGMRDEG